ncbi:hypothetical protein GCM10018952_74870 [Streptosporangium vulgare]
MDVGRPGPAETISGLYAGHALGLTRSAPLMVGDRESVPSPMVTSAPGPVVTDVPVPAATEVPERNGATAILETDPDSPEVSGWSTRAVRAGISWSTGGRSSGWSTLAGIGRFGIFPEPMGWISAGEKRVVTVTKWSLLVCFRLDGTIHC